VKYYLDLHLHSKFSRAVSSDMDLEHLEASAKRKGIQVLGTGDFTHPQWFAEIKNKLKEFAPGVYKLSADSPVSFLVSGEISCIYTQGTKVRKIHLLVLPSSVPAAEKINLVLNWIGNLKSDGRPILGVDVKSLSSDIWRADPAALIIPAHVWTPWFSLYGANSGFDSIKEAFGELADRIYALETGLSSDPEMNWRVEEIRSKVLVSNSDAHSPGKIGRELTVIETSEPFSFLLLAALLKEGYQSAKGKISTVEFYPEEGKYHLDGHRNCGVCLVPEETKKANYLCSKCGRPITVGVLHRVEKLSNFGPSMAPTGANFSYAVPLKELIGQIENVGAISKKVEAIYQKIIAQIPEIQFLLEAGEEDLVKVGGREITRAILAMRAGEVERIPGYDGKYGKIMVKVEKDKEIQASLF